MHKFDPENPLRIMPAQLIAENQFQICNRIATSREWWDHGCGTFDVMIELIRYFEFYGWCWEPDPIDQSATDY